MKFQLSDIFIHNLEEFATSMPPRSKNLSIDWKRGIALIKLAKGPAWIEVVERFSILIFNRKRVLLVFNTKCHALTIQTTMTSSHANERQRQMVKISNFLIPLEALFTEYS